MDAPVEGKRLRRSLATEAQVKAIYLIAREQYGLAEEQMNHHTKKAYGRLPAELAKQEASQLIDRLKGKSKGD